MGEKKKASDGWGEIFRPEWLSGFGGVPEETGGGK